MHLPPQTYTDTHSITVSDAVMTEAITAYVIGPVILETTSDGTLPLPRCSARSSIKRLCCVNLSPLRSNHAI